MRSPASGNRSASALHRSRSSAMGSRSPPTPDGTFPSGGRGGWPRAQRVCAQPAKGRRLMANQDQASTEPTPDRVLNPVPVTPVPRDGAARRAGIRRGERHRPARSPSRGPGSQEPGSRTGAGDGGRSGAGPSRRPSPEGKAGRAGGTPAVSAAIGARGLRYGQKHTPRLRKEGLACSRPPISGSGEATM
jgi:hypothetical protein